MQILLGVKKLLIIMFISGLAGALIHYMWDPMWTLIFKSIGLM